MNQAEFSRQMSHVDVLLSQGKFEYAEDIIDKLLATGYEGSDLLKMMALAKVGLGEYDTAEEIIKKVLATHPDDAFLFYLLASVKGANRKYKEAIGLMDEAIRIDPTNADFFAFKANLLLQLKDYALALSCSDTALALDGENIDALNARSTALMNLGKKEEAFQTIKKSLSTDPNNASTHANVGWGLLHHGKSVDALIHFKEALKANPTDEYAKSGMLEAMKARFPMYRYFLMVMLWFGKLKGRYQWTIIIGGYLLYRILLIVVENNEKLQVYLLPIIILLLLFFISTWIFSPLMNLYLLTNPYGRITLTPGQKQSAKYVGVSLLSCIILLLIYTLGFRNDGLLSSAIFSFALMIPLGSMNNAALPNNGKRLRYFTIIIILFVLLDSLLAIRNNTFTSHLFFLPICSLIAYQWYINYLLIRE